MTWDNWLLLGVSRVIAALLYGWVVAVVVMILVSQITGGAY